MVTWLARIRPVWLVGGAIGGFGLGVIGLYAGWERAGPVALFAGVLLSILAAIMITTPEPLIVETTREQENEGTEEQGDLASDRAEAVETTSPAPDADLGVDQINAAPPLTNADPEADQINAAPTPANGGQADRDALAASDEQDSAPRAET